MEQLEHISTTNKRQLFPITVIGEELRTPQNVGMSFRVSEAFGVESFYLNSNSPGTENRLVQRTARNTDKTLNIISYNNITTLLKTLKENGYIILALEITNKSKNIQEYNFLQYSKIALLIGSERFGIQKKALEMCTESIHIPMFGSNSSMNVVNSLSISLYEITKQLKNTTNNI